MTDKTTTITTDDGRETKLPTFGGTHGPDVVDVRSLQRETGLFTYDPGYASTASCKSAITFIDGNKGVLLYRGYPITSMFSATPPRFGVVADRITDYKPKVDHVDK